MVLFVFDSFKPRDYGCHVFPLVEFGCSRDFVSCASFLAVVSTSLLAVVSTLSSMLSFLAMFSFCFLSGRLV